MFDFSSYFENGLGYEDYLRNWGEPSDAERWQVVFDSIQLSDEQTSLLQRFTREMRGLVMAGAWCGDCVAQCPIWHRFSKVNPLINIRFVDRDQFPELAEELQICGGSRVPQLVLMSEDHRPVARLGDRTLSKYRQMASSVFGVEPPGTTTADVVQDWLDEFERAQYILRLSPGLRAKHGD